ncbi:MAG TPA: MBL fold metallo-hydrolase [Solirubrobacteraceae bacterium]|jgi:glyoxylase-like metal-dependent hydrolase (beta-lactamase superfamily II)
MEVAPGIHRIEAPLGDRFVALYLLAGEESTLLVDTGLDETPRSVLLPYLGGAGIDPRRVRYVLTTHADFDHTGGNASFREIAPEAVTLCHWLDRPLVESIERMIADRYGEFAADHGIDDSEETKSWIRANARHVPVDVALAGGEEIRLGPDWRVEVLHTPGHSRGHLSVHDPRSRSVVIADTTLWNAVLTRDGAPAFPPTYRYVDTYLASLHRLQGMEIETLLTSHYPVFRGAAVAEFLGESRAFVDRVDASLREELSRAGTARTTRDLIESLGPRLGTWPAAAGVYLVFPLVGHLERLLQYGRVAAERRDRFVAWRWLG